MSPITLLGITLTVLSAARPVSAATSTTAGASQITSKSTLLLAKSYTGSSFETDFTYYTADDPTSGYVNYVSLADAQSDALVDVQGDGSFIMRADSSDTASGRGRNSVRITSKDEFGDGVYILDLNHMPVGCGTWPAFWTTTPTGWPKGGEIDIIEGANALPALYGAAYNATTGLTTPSSGYPQTYDISSLHTSDECVLDSTAYMTGTIGSSACSAYNEGNTGCGVELGTNTTYGVDSFGANVNSIGGGWYAMWRDMEVSGGIYIYFWPRNSASVPSDVRNASAASTNVAEWGEPGANLSVPSCSGDFDNHVIVFDLTFCGDYASATYTASGCPADCSSFVMNNPSAFAEAFWSVNSLRVYTASGKPAKSGDALSGGAIAGIVVGGVVALVIAAWLGRRCLIRRHRRRLSLGVQLDDSTAASTPVNDSYSNIAAHEPIEPPRYQGLLRGETPTVLYHDNDELIPPPTPHAITSRSARGSWVG